SGSQFTKAWSAGAPTSVTVSCATSITLSCESRMLPPLPLASTATRLLSGEAVGKSTTALDGNPPSVRDLPVATSTHSGTMPPAGVLLETTTELRGLRNDPVIEMPIGLGTRRVRPLEGSTSTTSLSPSGAPGFHSGCHDICSQP